MKIAMLHRFSTVGPRGKRRTIDGQLDGNCTTLVNESDDERMLVRNSAGNLLFNGSPELYNTLWAKGYFQDVSEPWN